MPNEGPVLRSRDRIFATVREAIESADQEVVLSIPAAAVPELEDVLRAAMDRDVLVLVLLFDRATGDEPSIDPSSLTGLATISRWSAHIAPVTCIVDDTRGLTGHGRTLDDGEVPDREAALFDNPHIAGSLYRDFVGNFWMVSNEIHAAEFGELPASYPSIRHTVVWAALYLRDGIHVRARAEGRITETDEETTVEGDLLTVRQGIVYPASNSFPIETGFVVRRDDGSRWSIGGPRATLEDFAATDVTLIPPADD